jgi:hypothetical protein
MREKRRERERESNAIDGKSEVEKKQAIHGRVGTD